MRSRRGGVGGGSHQVAAGRLVGTLLKDARHAVRLKVPNVGTEAVPVREGCNVEAFQVIEKASNIFQRLTRYEVLEVGDVVPNERAVRDGGPVLHVLLKLLIARVRERLREVALNRAEPYHHVVARSGNFRSLFNRAVRQ